MPFVPSPLSDPSPVLAIGLFGMLALLAWASSAVSSVQRGAAALLVVRSLGWTTAVLAGLSMLVGRSVGPSANPLIGRVIQIVVSAALTSVVAVVVAKRVTDLRQASPAAALEPPAPAATRNARGSLVALGFVAVLLAVAGALWLVLARAGAGKPG